MTLALRPGVAAYWLDASRLVVDGPSLRYEFHGPEAKRVATILERAAAGRLSAGKADKAVSMLEEAGVLVARGKDASAFWDSRIPPRRTNGASVAILGAGTPIEKALAAQLRRAGLRVALRREAAQGRGSLLVSIGARVDGHDLRSLNRQVLEDGRPWLCAAVEGPAARVGPLVLPGATPCLSCYALRRMGTDPLLDQTLALSARTPFVAGPPATDLPPSAVAWMAGLVGQAATAWLRGLPAHPAVGGVITLDLATLRWHAEPLLRLPDCPDCGERIADVDALDLEPT